MIFIINIECRMKVYLRRNALQWFFIIYIHKRMSCLWSPELQGTLCRTLSKLWSCLMMVMNSSWEIEPSQFRSSLLNSSSALVWSAWLPTISYTAKIVLFSMGNFEINMVKLYASYAVLWVGISRSFSAHGMHTYYTGCPKKRVK